MSVLIQFFMNIQPASGQTPRSVIRGIVLDAQLKTPLPGASVRILDLNPAKGAISKKDGSFTIDSVPVGLHSVSINYIGYKEVTLPNVELISGKDKFLRVNMEESVVKADETVVTAYRDFTSANNEITQASVFNLQPETINRYAGARSDPARLASDMAGVAGDDNQRNDIIVRGNSPLGVLWRIEGADVPNPNHFSVAGTGGGVFAIINNNMLSNCDFITGAFPSEYGNKTAAVFDIQFRNGNNERSEKTFQIGLNGIEFNIEGPLSIGQKASYLAGVRFVTLEPLAQLGLDLSKQVVPQFMDLTYKINIPTKDYGTFVLWGIGGYSKASNKKSEDDDLDWNFVRRVEDENIESSMYSFGGHNTHFIGDRAFGNLNLNFSQSYIYTHNEYVFADRSTMPSERYKGIEQQFQLSYTYNNKLTSAHFLKIGGTVKALNFDDNFYEWSDGDSAYIQKMDEKGNAELYSGFINWQYKINEFIETNTGVYGQYFGLNKTWSVEPRFSIGIDITETDKLAFAFGMHSQTHPLLYYFFSFRHEDGNSYRTNFNLDMTRSTQFVLSYSKRFWGDFSFKTDIYYQYLYDVPVSKYAGQIGYTFMNLGAEFSFNPTDSTINAGKGRNYGIEFTLDKQFSNSWYTLFTISLFQSKYTTTDNVERNTAFNLGHVVNFLIGKEFGLDNENRKKISLDLKFAHIGGRRVVPIDIQKSIQYGGKVYDITHAYEEQFDDIFRIDFKLSYTVNLESVTHTFFIAADNMLNTKNPWKQNWNSGLNQVTYEYQLGLFPYFGYKVNF